LISDSVNSSGISPSISGSQTLPSFFRWAKAVALAGRFSDGMRSSSGEGALVGSPLAACRPTPGINWMKTPAPKAWIVSTSSF